MRILHVNHRDPRHPRAGGLEELIHQVSLRWIGEGHEVYQLCSGEHELSEEENIEGVRVRRIGREEYFNFMAARELAKWPSNKPDVILEHISKVPCYLGGRTGGIPFAVHVPHLFGSSAFQETNPLFATYVCLLESRLGTAYRTYPFWALCPSTRDELMGRGIPPANIEVISGGVSVNEYVPLPSHLKTAHPSLIYVGRLKKYKGIPIILEAIKRLSNEFPAINLTITGRGDYLSNLKEAVNALRIKEHVHFAGFVDVPTKIRLLQESWVLLYPSPKEGWGLSVIEAGACSTPTIASNSPGLRDSVVHEKTGILVEHRNIEQWVEKIRLLLKNHSLRTQYSEAALHHAQQFDWNVVAQKALNFLKNTIQKSKAQG